MLNEAGGIMSEFTVTRLAADRFYGVVPLVIGTSGAQHPLIREPGQVLAEAGVIGLLAFLALLFQLGLQLLKRGRDQHAPERELAVLALALLIGLGAHTFFSFALRNPAPPGRAPV